MPDEIPAVIAEEQTAEPATPTAVKAKPSTDGLSAPKPRARRVLKKVMPGIEPRKEAAPADPEPVPQRPVLVEFKEVSKIYHGHLALDKVSVKLYKGEFMSLVGPSGAGKSTLIKCLTLQLRPDSGRIIVAGRDITMMRDREMPFYRRKIGIVFQDFRLLTSKTVGENVAFALEVSDVPRREIKRRVEQILETVGMLSKHHSFPHELSGGEQQRVAIARSLVHDPKILIADEPTGNLDPVNTWEIIELLYKINKSGTMVVLATHDREVVDALKKRVITLQGGRLVADQERGTYIV